MNSPFGNRSTSPSLPPSRREHESEQLLAPLREEYDVRVVIALEVENRNDSEIDRTRSLKRAQAARKRISATSRRVPSAERAKTAAFVLE